MLDSNSPPTPSGYMSNYVVPLSGQPLQRLRYLMCGSVVPLTAWHSTQVSFHDLGTTCRFRRRVLLGKVPMTALNANRVL